MELTTLPGMDLLLLGRKMGGVKEGDLDLGALQGARSPEERRQSLRKASQEFEAVFIRQMIETMRQTVGKGGLVEKSNGEEIFESMLDEEWAKKIASKGGPNSLSEILYRQLSRQMGLEEETVPTKGKQAEFMEQMSGARMLPAGLRRGGGERP